MKNTDLIRSLQKIASATRIGENSLFTSERVSIGSKLKESKMSAASMSTNGYESSVNSRGQKTGSLSSLQKLANNSEFKNEESKTLQISNGVDKQVPEEDSTPAIKASLTHSENDEMN